MIRIFLGIKSSRGGRFRAPCLMHQAPWITKAVQSVRIWLFPSQFKLANRTGNGLYAVVGFSRFAPVL